MSEAMKAPAMNNAAFVVSNWDAVLLHLKRHDADLYEYLQDTKPEISGHVIRLSVESRTIFLRLLDKEIRLLLYRLCCSVLPEGTEPGFRLDIIDGDGNCD